MQKTFGSRTYPVGYTYDYAGRMKTMTTWRRILPPALARRVTTWNYDGYRGFLTNKSYADGKGPNYSYTAAGRLGSRTVGASGGRPAAGHELRLRQRRRPPNRRLFRRGRLRTRPTPSTPWPDHSTLNPQAIN